MALRKMSTFSKVTMTLRNRAGSELTVVADKLDPNRFEEFYKLYRGAAENDDGFSAEEMTREYLQGTLKSHHYVSMVNQDSGELVAVNGIYDTKWSRGQRALTHATATVVDPKYRGYGMARGKSIKHDKYL